jgi:transposase
MQPISTIGLDIAKSVFQVHGVDAVGQVILRRQLRRRRNDPGKERIRKWLIDIDDAKLQSDLGLTLEDIAVLRE